MGTPFSVGIVPSGTLNALAGEMGIPRALDEAVAVAVGGRPRRIDLGLANGRPFAQMAGVGFDGAVVSSVVPSVSKNMLGISALTRGLRLLATYAPTKVSLTTESALVEAEAWLVLVANARHYTYGLRVAARAVVDDGWLDVWLFASGPGTLVAGQVVGLLRGRPGRCRGVCHVRARRLRIESDPPVLVHVPASGSTAE
jgi:diacylglycerol kinase family enzyme